ncbi:MAG: O-antigen ligase family protein [Anaerolineales bacterium]|nr:O-antigen ligase family protein [Anaerolineales bacterium]
MLDTTLTRRTVTTVEEQIKRNRTTQVLLILGMIGTSLVSAFLMLQTRIGIGGIYWSLFIIAAGLVLFKPRIGLYMILFFGLVGDANLMPEFPFDKNMSSAESFFYLHDALIVNPLELFMGLMLLGWLGRKLMRRRFHLEMGELFWPVMAFTGFVLLGIFWGLSTGGDARIAVWESRSMFYLPVMMILVTNLVEKREHFSHMMWAIMAALLIESIVAVWVFYSEYGFSTSSLERLTEHGASVHTNVIYIFILLLFLYKGSSLTKRFFLPFWIPTTLIAYLASQRRAAFLSLGIGLVLVFFLLYRENRRAFWLITPPAVFLGLIYLGVFWNVQNPLGLPAQALKSVLVEDTSDYGSNLYRIIENYNIAFTIHQHPLTGVGFGQPFYIVWDLPDISFFEFWEYITHNSIVYIWMKMGVGGFIAMFVMIASIISKGVKTTIRMPGGDLSAIAGTMTIYVIMHFLFAYADISWDIQNMLFLGTAIGILNSIENVVARPVELAPKRWPWQPEPAQPGQLLPMPSEAP